jgi:ABC-2 type transport system permease protein
MNPPAAAHPGLIGPMISLLEREVLRFVRQRSRLISSALQPVLFWVLLGAGFGASFKAPTATGNVSYLAWSFPGILVLVLLFTAVFSTISIIEDRQTGFLQAVLASPVPRLAIVLGKVFGSATLAVGEAGLVLLAAPLAGLPLTLSGALLALLALTGIALSLTGMGFCIAWRMDSTQGFHMVMNMFLLPMWLLSGAFFPLEGAAPWLRLVMEINPLTYGVTAVRLALAAPADADPQRLALSLGVTAFFAVATLLTAVLLVRARAGTSGR